MGQACAKSGDPNMEAGVEMKSIGINYTTEELAKFDEINKPMLDEWKKSLENYRNESIWNRELLCIACIGILYEPVTLPTGHTYCGGCLRQLSRVRKDCAASGKELPPQDQWKGASKALSDKLKESRPPNEEKSRAHLLKHKVNTELTAEQIQGTDRVEFIAGVWGEVGKAKVSDKYVGYKRLLLELDEPRVADFQKRINIYQHLRHVSLVLLVGAIPTATGGLIYEYCPNGNLHDLLCTKKFRMDLEIYLHTARDIAAALNFLHCNGVHHGALNTNQLLVDHKYRVKLMDFGFQQVRDHARIHTYSLGNARYFAPEVHQSKKGFSLSLADVYAFGVLLWEMYTCLEPFPLWTDAELVTNLIFKRARPKIPSHCPTELATLMEECWNEEPQSRPTFYAIAVKKLPALLKKPQHDLIPRTNPNEVHDEESLEQRDHITTIIKVPEEVPPNAAMQQTLRFSCIMALQAGLMEKIVIETSLKGITGYSYNVRNKLEVSFQHSWVHVRAFSSKGDTFTYFWAPFAGYERPYKFRSRDLGKIIYDRALAVMGYLTKNLLQIRKAEKSEGKGTRTKAAVAASSSGSGSSASTDAPVVVASDTPINNPSDSPATSQDNNDS